MNNIELLKAWEPLGIDSKALSNALSEPRITSIRLNPAKVMNQKLDQRVPWCDTGYFLPERPAFTIDPFFQAGGYYVQEAGSMMLEQVIKQIRKDDKPITVLDLCAAPGGKSTLISGLLNDSDVLVANEVHPGRFQVLNQNLNKWGAPNVIRTSAQAYEYGQMDSLFDIVLIDAPCSGEGLLRRIPEHTQDWNLDMVAQCAVRQKEILANIWPVIKPGGHLIYSTCTWNQHENEEVLLDFLEEHNATSLPLDFEDSYGLKHYQQNGVYVYRCFPHLMPTEGFVFSVLQKSATATSAIPKKLPKVSFKPFKGNLGWVNTEFNYGTFVSAKEQLFYLSNPAFEMLNILDPFIKKIIPGQSIGELKGKAIRPNQGLAWLQTNAIKNTGVVEVDAPHAQGYFRREILRITAQTEFVMSQFKGLMVGTYSNAGNRLNNLLHKSYLVHDTRNPVETGVFNSLEGLGNSRG